MRFLSSALLFALLGRACLAQAPQPNSGLTPERAGEMEAKLQINPEDLSARADLLRFYSLTKSPENYTRHVIWFIENHPEYPAIDHDGHLLRQGGPLNTPGEYEEAKAAWERQLAKPHDSGAILLNAANFLAADDPQRALELLEEARKLDTAEPLYVGAEALIYTSGVLRFAAGDVTADPLKSQLMNSSDSELLGSVGRLLARVSSPAGVKEIGFELLERAISFDPSSRKWKAVLESAKSANGVRPRVVRIGGKVAEANVIEKVAPEYPERAKRARIQGVVEFTVGIGEDGLVKDLQLVRGHPLLVSAAQDAVLQWKYRPTTLNGNPVSVMTDVVISFTLEGAPAN
jgi:TonB family protein